jgi:hypothetical protein
VSTSSSSGEEKKRGGCTTTRRRRRRTCPTRTMSRGATRRRAASTHGQISTPSSSSSCSLLFSGYDSSIPRTHCACGGGFDFKLFACLFANASAVWIPEWLVDKVFRVVVVRSDACVASLFFGFGSERSVTRCRIPHQYPSSEPCS